MQGKAVRESISEYSEIALPNDANGLGNVLGGKVMHLVDLAAAMAAIRHARRPCVTAAVDSLQFLHPVRIGQLIVLRSSAYLTFVALDENGKAVEVAPVIPETEEEQRRYRQAGERREYRLAMRERLK